MDRTPPKGRKNGAKQPRNQRRAQSALTLDRDPVASDVRVVLDALPQPAFVVGIGDDEVCRFVHANARYRTLFDLDPDSDLGGDLRAVLPADVLVPHITAFSRASREGQSVSFDVVLENGRRALTVEIVQMPDDWSDERFSLRGDRIVSKAG